MRKIIYRAFITVGCVILAGTMLVSCTFESAFVDLIQEKINADLGITSEEIVPVTGITLDKPNLTVTSGYTEQLTAVIEPPEAADQSAAWSSSDESVAEVDDAGMVTGTGPGSATITAAASGGDVTARCEVLVLPKGEFDTSFNTVGYVRQELNEQGGWNAVHIDTQDRILVTGWAGDLFGDKDMYACRFVSSGSPDQTFSIDGIISYEQASSPDTGCDIITDSSGRVIIAGKIGNGPDFVDLAVWRYKENGNTDLDFTTVVYEGSVTSDSDVANGIVLDNSGKIIVAGYTRIGTDADIIIQRYNDDGTPNISFGDEGTVTRDHGETDWCYSVALDDDGKIVAAGRIYSGSDSDLGVWRFNSNGSPDNSFDDDGAAIYGSAELGNTNNSGLDVLVDGNGKILVVGQNYDGSDYYVILVRLNEDGSLDTSFGTGGKVQYNHGFKFNSGYGLCLDEAGNILVTGRVDVDASFNGRLAVWRYLPDGSPDPTFGSGGVFVCDDGISGTGSGIAADADGKIIVAGSSSGGQNIVYRFK